MIERLVRALPLVVFDQFLDGGDYQHDDERANGRISVCRRDVGDLLEDGGKEEKQVGVFGELFEEEFR